MKVLRFVAVVLCCAALTPARAEPAADADVVVVIAHRGASAYAPEHTIPAYDQALAMGADFIEQDLQLTSDGVLVVMHDSTLDRTARGPAENCAGAVTTKTLAQVKTCDMGTWFNERYPDRARPEYVGLTIPTLEEVFSRYGQTTSYHIETKSPEQAPGMEEALLALMGAHGLIEPARERWRVLIQSFSPLSLVKIHALDPALPLVQLHPGGAPAAVLATLDLVATYAVGVGPSSGAVDQSVVDAAHDRCLDVHPYTVDDPADLVALVKMGVDGVFTNRPDRLEQILGGDAVPGDGAPARAAHANRACRTGGP